MSGDCLGCFQIFLQGFGAILPQHERFPHGGGMQMDAFKKATDEPRAYNNLGVTLLGIGQAKQAAACFEKAIELNPQYYAKATENLRTAQQAIKNAPVEGASTESPMACP